MKISGIAGKVSAVLLSVLTGGGLILTAFGNKKDFSVSENRQLAEFPEFSFSALADGSYGEMLGAYMTDHFFQREKWLSAQAYIFSGMGEKLVNGIYTGRDRLLDSEISDRKMSVGNINAVNLFTGGYEGTVYFTAVPTSSGVYGEMLPDYLLTNPEKKQIEKLYDNLGDGIRTIDTYNILRMLNDSYIYYRNDTRLTSYGAYCVYRTIIQKLGFQPLPYDKYTIQHITSEFRGNLYNRCQYDGTKPDILDIYSYAGGAEIVSCKAYCNNGMTYRKTLNDAEYLEGGDMYRMYLGEEVPFIKIKTSVKNDKKLLLVKDSYADCFVQFLIQHYSEIAVVSPEYMEKPISSFVNPDNYGQALFLFGIDTLSNDGLFDLLNE